jgi:hypothetical protein
LRANPAKSLISAVSLMDWQSREFFETSPVWRANDVGRKLEPFFALELAFSRLLRPLFGNSFLDAGSCHKFGRHERQHFCPFRWLAGRFQNRLTQANALREEFVAGA